jgi:hypothetical protein
MAREGVKGDREKTPSIKQTDRPGENPPSQPQEEADHGHQVSPALEPWEDGVLVKLKCLLL